MRIEMAASILLLASSMTFAGEKSRQYVEPKAHYIETGMAMVPPQHLPDISSGNIAQLKQKAKEISLRMPASEPAMGEFESKNLSPKLIEKRQTFLNIKTPEDVRAFLDEMDRDYDTYPADLKYMAAQLALLRPMEGVVYRAANLFEKTRVTHSYALSWMRGMASTMEVFFPTEQWESLFKFMTVPTDKTSPQFANMADFQNFLVEKLNPAMDKAITRLDALAKSMDKSFVFDKQFLYGKAGYELVVDRYRGIGPAEIYATLAGLSMGMHNLLVYCAYDQWDLIKIVEAVGRLHGFDGLLPDHLTGVNPKSHYAKIESYQYFLKLRPVLRTEDGFFGNKKTVFTKVPEGTDDSLAKSEGAYGKSLMGMAFDRLKNAVAYSDASWSTLQKEPVDDEMALLRPGIYRAYSRQGELTMATWKGMIEGKMTVQSVTVSTESAKLDLPAFYHTPVADLKDLFPTGFDSSPETMRAPASLGGEYRNYLSGRPTQWNSGPDAWGRFVTGPDGNLAPAQVADVLRILYQAWGGRYTSWPFRFVTK